MGRRGARRPDSSLVHPGARNHGEIRGRNAPASFRPSTLNPDFHTNSEVHADSTSDIIRQLQPFIFVLQILCLPSDNVQRVSIAKNDEQKMKARKRTTSQTDLTHRRPPKRTPLHHSSVQQRLSPPPSKRFQRSIDQTRCP